MRKPIRIAGTTRWASMSIALIRELVHKRFFVIINHLVVKMETTAELLMLLRSMWVRMGVALFLGLPITVLV